MENEATGLVRIFLPGVGCLSKQTPDAALDYRTARNTRSSDPQLARGADETRSDRDSDRGGARRHGIACSKRAGKCAEVLGRGATAANAQLSRISCYSGRRVRT